MTCPKFRLPTINQKERSMKIAQIESASIVQHIKRIDANYHLSPGVEAERAILKCPNGTETLGRLSSQIFKGGRSKRCYVKDPKNGYELWGITEVLKSTHSGSKLISKKFTHDSAGLFVNDGWVLVARSGSGAIGTAVYANKEFEGKIISEDLLRIVPSQELLGGALYAFFASKHGYNLMQKGIYGTAIPHIEPDYAATIPIPIFPKPLQKQIHDLVVEAANLKVEANRLLEEAVAFFEEEIGISKAHLGYQFAKIPSKAILGAHKRFDSQYQLVQRKLEEECKEDIVFEKIRTISNAIFVGGRGKRNYVEDGVPFLSSSDMMLFNPKRGCKKISKKTHGIEAMVVSKKDILISRSGTVGNVVLVGQVLDGTAISEHALRLVVDSEKISPNYVFCFFKTKRGLRSLEATAYGSVIITLNEDYVGDVELPILNQEQQSLIEGMVEDYLLKMDIATSKENEAINKVEKEIESWPKS